jgi:hypothetical protein
MIRSTLLAIVAGLVLALAATVTISKGLVQRARADVAVLAMEGANLRAERDTTRLVSVADHRVAALLGDSLRLVERLAIQTAQRRDVLDQALGRERMARHIMKAAVDSLASVSRALTTRDSSGAGTMRRASFVVREPPYSIAADVELPAPPDSGRLDLHVKLDPIVVEARLSCLAPDSHGIRSAAISASSPRWATVELRQVEQAPEVCNPPNRADARRRRFAFAPVVVGIGWLMTHDGRGSWGAFAGLGFSL